MKRWSAYVALPATALATGGLILTGGAAGSATVSPHHSSAASHPAAKSAAQARANADSQERSHPDGAVKSSSHIRFEMVLRMRDAAGAKRLVREVSTPSSTHYRHYVTAAAWEKSYSPKASTVRSTEKWLRTHHFTVSGASKDRLTISVSATAHQIEKTFGTTLRYYRVNGHKVRLAAGKINVPAALPAVTGTLGVNQHLSTPEDASTIPPPAAFITSGPCANYYGQKSTTTSPKFGQGYPTTVPDTVCGYVPGQFRGAYDIPSADTGKGTTVAIVDAYGSSTQPADAKEYFAKHDPSNPVTSSNFSQDLNTPYDDEALCGASGWQTEQAIDIEAAHGMAPGAHILYVGAQDCADGLFTALQNVIDKHQADVISNSYGDYGELVDDQSYESAIDDELMMADSTGISVLFSSGDDGDSFDLAGISEPTYPAASSYGTAVGGTTLAIGKSDKRLADYGWSTGRSLKCSSNGVGIVPGCTSKTVNTWLPVSLDGASGGGTDYFNAQPSYQKGIVPASISERNSPLNGPAPYRTIPDISMEADPSTGLLIGLTEQFPNGKDEYGETRYGGTSLASPLFAGVLADADQVAGKPLGFVNPALYDLDAAKSSAIKDVLPPATPTAQARFDYLSQVFGAGQGKVESYREITYEGTEEYCDGTGNCATRPNTLSTAKGYDSLTGLGTIGSGFVKALAK